MPKLIQAATLALMLTPVAGVAQDFDAGLQAAQAGDFKTALENWRPLADHGDAKAQYILAWMYLQGQGVPQDYAEAAKWYRLAAEQGNADAEYILASMYYQGQGVPQDYAEAMKWYRLAAEQGNAAAQYSLGWMYAEGQSVPQDWVSSQMWFSIASANDFWFSDQPRDELAAKMTAADISEAQRRARVCMKSDYQECD